MKRLAASVIFFIAYFLLSSANDESASEPLIAAPTIELKRIQKPSSDLTASSSIARSYRHDDFDSIQEQSLSRSDSAPSSNGIFTETKKPAPKKSRQPSSKPSGYGYPYRMAPTLPPFVRHITDRYDDESETKSSIFPTDIIPSEPKLPPMPRLPSMPKISADDDVLSKREDSLKKRQGLPFDDVSSSSREISLEYNSYKEPSYRNFHDLEFSPRRMYYESGGPLSRPSYSFPSPKPSPPVSPRDPYLSPSSEPIDGFYPKVKNNGVSSSYSPYGKRDKYYKTVVDPVPPVSRGYGDNDDFSDTSSEEDDFRPGVRGYGGSDEYQEAPRPYSDPYSEPSPKEPARTSEEGSYDSLYNSPITGMTRKRLLTYAGASDLYEGEPDYLKSAALRKTKFGSIQDDYYPYPRSRSYSFDDHSYEESRKLPTRTKRQVTQQEETIPRCSRNTTIPLCMRDNEYPTAEVRKIVSKNMKFLSEMRNTKLEISEKKSIYNDPESLEDLKKTQSVCSSQKGYIYPKRAVDVDGIWRTVINVDGVKQSVEVDVCKSSETSCNYVPFAIPTKCVQKYSFVALITFNMKDNIMERHDFPVPSSCACSLGRPTRIRLE